MTMRPQRAALLLAVVALLFSACSRATDESAPGAGADSSADADTTARSIDLIDLDASLEEWAGDQDGGAVGLVRFADGTIQLADAGEDAATGDQLSAETSLVRIGSISKIYTATLVLALVEEGLVDLDETLTTYLDGFDFDEAITVRHLLAHQSGIPNYTENFTLMGRVLGEPDFEPTPRDILSYVAGGRDFAPGSQFSYSNSNYVLAGLLIEEVTGQTLDEVLAERISGQLGLTETGFDDGTMLNVAAGYTAAIAEGQSGARSYESIADSAWAAGAIVTTVSELATFLNALYVDQELIEPALVAEMIEGVNSGIEYGLGTHAGPDFGLGHGGSIVGFNSMAQVDPETGEMVIVVVNNDLRRADVASAVLSESAQLVN